MQDILAHIVIPGAAVLFAAVGASFAIYTYHKNSKIRRAEWLYSLFDKFFCQSSYAEIRKLFDDQSPKEVERLRKALTEKDDLLEEKVVDYLNFFEFIAVLWSLRQISIEEIRKMFGYYIRRLRKHDYVMKYLERYDFEGLVDLVERIGD